MEPLKDFQQGNEMFGKISLASTAQGGEYASIPEMDPGYPLAPCGMSWLSYLQLGEALALLFEISLGNLRGDQCNLIS